MAAADVRRCAGDSATLIAGLSIDAGTLPRPVWQEYKERATFLVPAFISAGLFIVVVGLGVVVMVVAQRQHVDRGRSGRRRAQSVHRRRRVVSC